MDKIDEFLKNKLYNNEKTKEQYRCHTEQFFKVIDKDINTYFQNAPRYNPTDDDKLEHYNTYYEQDIRTFWEYLSKKAPKTQQMTISIVKQFLKYGDKNTKNLDIWDTIQTRMKGTVRAISEEYVPEIPEIKRVLEYCDIKTKTAIYMAMSSGMRLGEVMELVPSDTHMNETPTRINIRAEITKNHQRRTTFISSEATELLKEWLRVRPDYIRDAYKSLNFTHAKHNKNNKTKDPRIFPFYANVIQKGFNAASDLAGFKETTPINGDDTE
jgi:integrase